MGKIIQPNDLSELLELKQTGHNLILTGGCFDILHPGHIQFLKSAKELGGFLVIMLESDEKARQLKGDKRPFNSQTNRSMMLANLQSVDYVIKLPYYKNDSDYEILVKNLEPDIIAVTEGSKIFDWERRYMDKTGGKIVNVIKRIDKYSTTKIADAAKL